MGKELYMGENMFTPEQQGKIEEIVKERIARVEKKYSDYEDLKKKAADYDVLSGKRLEEKIKDLEDELKAEREKAGTHDKTVADLTARATLAEKKLLKNEIAQKHNLPLELAERLQGETEEELKADAQALSKLVSSGPPLPLKSTEEAQTDRYNAELKGMLGGLMSTV